MVSAAWLMGCAACVVLACGTTGTALTGAEAPGGALTSHAPADEHAFGQRAPGASDANAVYFNSGEGFFVQPWLEAPSDTPSRQGLGPLYDAANCAECHVGNGRGRPAFDPDDGGVGIVLRLSVPGLAATGAPSPDPTYGDQIQSRAVDGVTAEGTVSVTWRQLAGSYADGTPYTLLQPSYDVDALGYGPLDANCLESLRTAPATIGLGLLEAIPEARLRDLADPDDADGDGISGRINRVWDPAANALAVGRFGWKAEQPSL
ncbi:MAG TPA: di-heme oxidoredictase family protein, partial [Polyangiaceae bacterium]|nr:di-heme oxidoredictase family protein [Polyangiaceae bacterium]